MPITYIVLLIHYTLTIQIYIISFKDKGRTAILILLDISAISESRSPPQTLVQPFWSLFQLICTLPAYPMFNQSISINSNQW